jgi:hypothetical protein
VFVFHEAGTIPFTWELILISSSLFIAVFALTSNKEDYTAIYEMSLCVEAIPTGDYNVGQLVIGLPVPLL